MNTKMIQGIARHVIAAACVAILAGALARGEITTAQLNAILAHWQDLLASFGFLGAVGWSVLSKRDPKIAQEVQDAAASLGVDANSVESLHQLVIHAAAENLTPVNPAPKQAIMHPGIPPAAVGLLFICGLCALAVTQSGCTTTAGLASAPSVQAEVQAIAVNVLTQDPSARADLTAAANYIADVILGQTLGAPTIMSGLGQVISPTSKVYAALNDVLAQSAPDLAAIEAGITAALKATAPPPAPAATTTAAPAAAPPKAT